MKSLWKRGESKQWRKERWFLNTDRVPLSSSAHVGEIPRCFWLLQYINSNFHCEPGTWRIYGMGGKEGKPDELEKGRHREV